VIFAVVAIAACKKQESNTTSPSLSGKIKTIFFNVSASSISYNRTYPMRYKYDSLTGKFQAIETDDNTFYCSINEVASNKYIYRIRTDSGEFNQVYTVYTNAQNKIILVNSLDTVSQQEKEIDRCVYNTSNIIDSILSSVPMAGIPNPRYKNYAYQHDALNYSQSKLAWNDFFTHGNFLDTLHYSYNSFQNNINIPGQIPYFMPGITSDDFAINTDFRFMYYLFQLNNVTLFEMNRNLIQSINNYHYSYNISNNEVKEIFVSNDADDIQEHLTIEYY
jgi:hypothetical protein